MTRRPAEHAAGTPADGLRLELKFIAADTAYHDLVAWLRHHYEALCRPYPPRLVNNVYFDRFDYDTYDASVAGVSSRVKVRYRWYGPVCLPQPGQLEIKLRHNRFGWKRSFAVGALPEPACSWHEVKSKILEAVPPEGRCWLQEYGCPILVNRYERDYWVSRDSEIRITIDRNLSIYDQRYAAVINTSRRVDIPDNVIMEVKGPPGAAEMMSELVSELPVRLTRHSKYCMGVEALLGL